VVVNFAHIDVWSNLGVLWRVALKELASRHHGLESHHSVEKFQVLVKLIMHAIDGATNICFILLKNSLHMSF